MDTVEISSDTVLKDVEHHFRVRAGPGAGKTFWLVGHIKNVLHKSERLTPASRIACISYTNVAVNEIRKRLGSSAERVDVSTIHSFLYRNLVKPYLHLLRNDAGQTVVNFAQVDGHDEHRPSRTRVKAWLKKSLHYLIYEDWDSVSRCLKRLTWQRDEKTDQWSLILLPNTARPDYFPTRSLNQYKPFYWKDGIIDHEDVLYFAYRILNEHPSVRPFLSARFPYLFIDEFQDTNPVQTQVVNWLADSGTVVGVIGDAEQAIYVFQAARPQDFVDFSLPGIQDYTIPDNRRSTDRIIDLLNHVRGDTLKQVGHRKVQGQPVRVIVGDAVEVVSAVRRSLPAEDTLYVLARTNEQVSRLRRQQKGAGNNLWKEFDKVDSDRARFFERLVTATEAAHLRSFTVALKELMRGMWRRNGNARKPLNCKTVLRALQRRGVAVSVLEELVTDYQSLSASTLFEVYARVDKSLQSVHHGLSLTGVRPEKSFASFAQTARYADLADAVRLSEETRTVRTMHNAKGAEFDSVFVCLEDEKKSSRLDHLLTSDDSDDEERRVTYVALSRAENRLFLSVPQLDDDQEQRLRGLGLEVERMS
jgi:DNA helicase-2/ATP-dependent DNA helicase PcrA